MAELNPNIILGTRFAEPEPLGNTLLQLAQIQQIRAGTNTQAALQAKAQQEAAQAAIAQQAQTEFIEEELRRRQGGGLTAAPAAPSIAQAGGLNAPPIDMQQNAAGQFVPGGTFPPVQAGQPAGTGAPGIQQAGGVDATAEQFIARPRRFQDNLDLFMLKAPDLAREYVAGLHDQMGFTRETLSFVGRELASITPGKPDTEAQYQAMASRLRQAMRQGGLDPETLPPVYDKAAIDRVIQRGRTDEQTVRRADQELRQITQDFREQEAETKRQAQAGKIRDFGLTSTGNAKAAELFPDHPAGQPLSGPQMSQINDELAQEKADFAGSIRAAVVAATAEANRQNIRLTPAQIDKFVNRSEILGIAEAIKNEFSDADFRKFFGLKNFAARNLSALKGNPRAIRLLTLTGRLRSALLFDREKGGGGALSPNEQQALETAIPTGREVNAEQFIQKRNILQSVASGQLSTNLSISLGTNPQELTRVQDLLRKQRGTISPSFDTPISAARREELSDIVDSVRSR